MARLGFVTELLSKPIRYGYMNGIALTVLISQLPKLFGFSIDADGPAARDPGASPRALLDGKTNWRRVRGRRRHAGRDPAAQALAARARHPDRRRRRDGRRGLFDLAASAGVAVLGPLPQGLPAFAMPWIAFADIVPVLIGGFAVALVSFADTSVLSRTYAARTRHLRRSQPGDGRARRGQPGRRILPGLSDQQQLVAHAGGRGRGREDPADRRGRRARGRAAAGVRTRPAAAPAHSALAAVVIASAIGLIEIADLRRIYRIQRWEFWLSIGCFAGVAVLGAIPGIGLAIVIAVIEFLWDGWRPHSAVLGRVDGVKGYHDITRYPDARRIPGLVLFRWDAPLFFANAELFHDRVLEAVAASPTPVRWVVVAAEPVTSVDVTVRRHAGRARRDAARGGHRAALRRDEGPGQGQAEALRTVRAPGRGSLLSDRRRGRQRLSRGTPGGLGGLGRCERTDTR